ncbi:hypothetical protein OSTOST_01438 [Ostertagia ostertagi]
MDLSGDLFPATAIIIASYALGYKRLADRHSRLPPKIKCFPGAVANGLAILSEKPMEGDYDRYELVGIVAAIGDGNGQWTHSLILIKDDADSKSPWCLFDDVLVTRVHEDEALHMDSRWKLPLILCYAKEKSDLIKAVEREVGPFSTGTWTEVSRKS